MDPNAVFQRNEKFYLSGGDIILAAKFASQTDPPAPQIYALFRVHKFLLGLRSQVFHNLFADADAAAPNDSYDGLPLVELHGDKPEDLTLILSYIYEPETYAITNLCSLRALSLMLRHSFLAFRRYDPNVSIAVSGAVRLSDKYLLEPLRKRLVAHVVEEWPTTLRNWDIQQAELQAIEQTIFSVTTVDGDAVGLDELLSDRLPEPVSAIAFAQEFGCPQILPAAFYRLLQISFKADWSLRAAGPAPSDPTASPYAHSPLARWHLLDKDTLTRYVRGLHEAEEYEAPTMRFVSSDCRPSVYDDWETDSSFACYKFVKNMVSVLGKGRGGTATRDPLSWLKNCVEQGRFPELEKHHDGLCEQCEVVLREAVAMERQRIWQELVPKWFQLQ